MQTRSCRLLRTTSLPSAIVLSLFWIVSPSSGQPPLPARSAELAAERADDPSLADTVWSALSGVSAEGGAKRGKARFKFSKNNGKHAVGLTFASPFERSQKAVELATLDGLADHLSLGVAYTRGFLPRLTKEGIEGQSRVCADLDIHPRAECSDTSVRTKAAAMGRDPDVEVDRFFDASFADSKVWLVSVEARGGRSTIDYVDSDTRSDITVTTHPTSLAFAVGWLSSALYTVKLAHQQQYKEGDLSVVCGAGEPTSGMELCEQRTVGAPTRRSATLLSFSRRQFLTHVALSPKFTYDIRNKDLELEVPVYFIRNPAGQFIGGLRFGWARRESTTARSLSVFVAYPLSFL